MKKYLLVALGFAVAPILLAQSDTPAALPAKPTADAKVVSSPELSLSAAALDAVQHWRYKPATLGGQPTEVQTHINLDFAPKR